MSDQTFQQYSQTLKAFYLKVIKNHSSMLKLSRNFMQMIQDLSKSENTLKNSGYSRKKSQKSHSQASRGIKSLRHLNSPKTTKNQYIYTSPDLKKVILYSYLHHIITISNTEVFNIIEAKSKLLIQSVQENKILDRIKWDRCVNQWKKIMQLMNHKTKVRWQKMMNIAVTGLQPEFLDVVLRSIMQSSSQMHTIFAKFYQNVEVTSGLLKVSILYEEYDGESCLKKIQAGDSKYQIKIGYLKHENTYVYYDKLLVQKLEKSETEKNAQEQKKQKDKNFLSVKTQGSKKSNQLNFSPASSKNDSDSKSRNDLDAKSEQSIGQQSKKRPTLPPSLIKKKNLRIIESLLKEYQSNTTKLLSLECFQNQQSKDAKIKRILQSRKKIQQ